MMKILVVDDDPTARLLMRAALVRSGFDVAVADGGQVALQQFAQHHFDMVLLDVEMPDMNGLELCSALRAKGGEILPIVMVTGLDDVKSVEAAFAAGATDFISKPINWALIGHRANYLLRASGAFRELSLAHAQSTQAQAELARSQSDLNGTLNAIPDLLFEIDLEGRYYSVRTPQSDLLVAPSENLIGGLIGDTMAPDSAAICMAALHEANDKGYSRGHQFKLQLGGSLKWFELSVARKESTGAEGPRFIVLSRDISERKETESRISRLAYFDSLTGLPNRAYFLERLTRELERARRNQTRAAILYMDLDGFKDINDSLGHDAGDQILQAVADRLREVVRPSDMVSRASDPSADEQLARLGGDEFTLLILDLTDAQQALSAGNRIRSAIQRPFVLDSHELRLTASIGIAMYPDDGQDVTTLVKHADTAMYHGKEVGRDSCQFYSAALTQRAVQRIEMDRDLRIALEQGVFWLAYQPQVDANSGHVCAVEALIRWDREQHGPIAPLDFIPLAEANGLIVPIGQWVIRSACEAAVRWREQGNNVRVAVNLSPRQLRSPNLVQSVQDALAQTGLAPDMLELEVTETALMEDTAQTVGALRSLRALGVQLALDDFGTGYSSMSYLTRMPLNNLKIDRSFVAGLLKDSESDSIVRAIVSMAKALRLRVTAEGVETLEQSQCLKEMGCDVLQGYYYGRPVAADAMSDVLARKAEQ